MTYHQNNGTITSSATEMPERMRLGKDFRGGWSTFAASSNSPVFVRVGAPLTPVEAMEGCEAVAALVDTLRQLAWHPSLKGLAMTERAQAALTTFIKESDG